MTEAGQAGVPGGRPGSGEASGCAHKAARERTALPLPARSAPRSSSVSPGQTSGSEAGAQPPLDPAPLSKRQNASWISNKMELDSPRDPSPSPLPSSSLPTFFFLRSKESTRETETERGVKVYLSSFFPRGSQKEKF